MADAIAREAETKGITPTAMLDRIVKDWFGGQVPDKSTHKPKAEKPWYL